MEKVLMRTISPDDKKQIKNLFHSHYNRLYTLAVRMTGNKEDAEDILQTSFTNALSAVGNFRGDSSLFTWLYKIVYRCGIRHYQEEQKLPVTIYSEENNVAEHEVYSYINRYPACEDDEFTEMVRESCLQLFMNCMPLGLRAIFTLRVILEFSVKETAYILDKTENAVKTGLSRARTILRDHFEGRCSLVQPGAMCQCRTFARHIAQSQDCIRRMPDIRIIRRKEKISRTRYIKEMKSLREIENLYRTDILPQPYESFIEHLKSAAVSKKISLLG
ncbi:MAG: RNA polymerase sigma factor [Fibrobacter sp.]|nr:RNA polymerase sigma factor [Fibrobacter sp.]